MVLPTARLFFTTWALLSTTAPTETTATATARTTCSAFVGTRTRTRSSKSFATINVNPKSVYSSHASNSSAGATKLTASNSRKISTLRQHESLLVVANYNHDLDDECPPGYYLDSVNTRCNKLGPLGRASQIVERVGPLEQVSRGISNLFGIDRKAISSLGVTFALSYSLLSNINGSISLSVAWYMFCQRTGLSPLVPGQWKSLLKAYGTLYAILQLLRPFRVASAIAMSKLSGEFLEQTQDKFDCSRRFAIFFQYGLGWVVWMAFASFGIALASLSSGVPVWTATIY